MVKQRVQRADAGSTPSSPLHFKRVALREVSAFIKEHHYSHTHPGGITHAFALYYNGALAGAAVFGYMAGNGAGMVITDAGSTEPRHFRELMRLVLLDEVPANAESLFVAWCIRQLKREPELLGLVSYADTLQGHTGVIYKATNWRYAGQRIAHHPRIFVDGVELHPRMAHDRFGTGAVGKLRKLLGERLKELPAAPKLRYEYLLRKRNG